jgi:hypothetical protein
MDCDLDEDYMLFILNTLGQTYNFSSRFNVNNFIIADMKDIKFKHFIKESLEKGYMVKNQKGHNIYSLSKINNNDKLYFDSRFLEEKSRLYVIYDSVILKYSNNHKNKVDFDKKHITLSSLSKWDSISIEDILLETSKMAKDKNKIIVDFNYNYNKYRTINKYDCYSIVLEPGFTI